MQNDARRKMSYKYQKEREQIMQLTVNKKKNWKTNMQLFENDRKIIGVWQNAPKDKNIEKLIVFYISVSTSMVGWIMVPSKMFTP